MTCYAGCVAQGGISGKRQKSSCGLHFPVDGGADIALVWGISKGRRDMTTNEKIYKKALQEVMKAARANKVDPDKIHGIAEEALWRANAS